MRSQHNLFSITFEVGFRRLFDSLSPYERSQLIKSISALRKDPEQGDLCEDTYRSPSYELRKISVASTQQYTLTYLINRRKREVSLLNATRHASQQLEKQPLTATREMLTV